MQIDDTILGGIGIAVSAGFVALWVQIRAQIADLRSQLRDAVKRIRELEDERAKTLQDVARTNRHLINSLRQRPCLVDQVESVAVPAPGNLPESEVETDRIMRTA